MMWTFQLSLQNCFGPVFCLFTFYSNFMVCFIFLCLYYTDPFKIHSMKNTWKLFFWNNPCLHHFSKCLSTLLTCCKDKTLSKWYRNNPHSAETFWTIKELSRHSDNIPDILESFHTIGKLSRHSGNFPDNMESVHTIFKAYRQPIKFLDNQ